MNITHPELVRTLRKPGQKILDDLTPDALQYLKHAAELAIAANRVLAFTHVVTSNGDQFSRPSYMDIYHMAVGLSGEAGELIDTCKKHALYDAPLNVVNLAEELGDLEFFFEGFEQCRADLQEFRDENLVFWLKSLRIEIDRIYDMAGFTREQILQGNIDKLLKRYPNGGFSNADAQARADKVPATAA